MYERKPEPRFTTVVLTLLIVISIIATMTMLGCVDTLQPQGLEELRGEKAEEIKDKIGMEAAEKTGNEEKVSEQSAALENLTEKANSLDDGAVGLSGRLETLSTGIANASMDSDSIEDSFKKAKEELQKLKDENAALKEEIASLSAAVKELRNAGVAGFDEYLNKLDDLEEKRDRAEELLVDQEKRLAELEKLWEEKQKEAEEEPPKPIVYTRYEPSGDIGDYFISVPIRCPGCGTEGEVHRCDFCQGYYCTSGHEEGITHSGVGCGHMVCYNVPDGEKPKSHQDHICQYGCNYCAASGTHGYAICAGDPPVQEKENVVNIENNQQQEPQSYYIPPPQCERCGHFIDGTNHVQMSCGHQRCLNGDTVHRLQICGLHYSCGDTVPDGLDHSSHHPCGHYPCQHPADAPCS